MRALGDTVQAGQHAGSRLVIGLLQGTGSSEKGLSLWPGQAVCACSRGRRQ